MHARLAQDKQSEPIIMFDLEKKGTFPIELCNLYNMAPSLDTPRALIVYRRWHLALGILHKLLPGVEVKDQKTKAKETLTGIFEGR